MADIYVMNDVLLKNRAELEHIAIDIKQQSTEIDDMLELYEKMVRWIYFLLDLSILKCIYLPFYR